MTDSWTDEELKEAEKHADHSLEDCKYADISKWLATLARVLAEKDEMFTAKVVDECVATETAKLRHELTRLRGVLQKYGKHDGCGCAYGSRGERIASPTCDLDAERTEIRKCPASATSDPPQDCDAPFCGCNPAWLDALAKAQESGWLNAKEAARLRAEREASDEAWHEAVEACRSQIADEAAELTRLRVALQQRAATLRSRLTDSISPLARAIIEETANEFERVAALAVSPTKDVRRSR